MREFTTQPVTQRPSDPVPPGAGALVWHYCGAEALQSIISKHELWASSVAFMNDANEVITGSDALRQRFDRVKEELPESVAATLEGSLRARSSESEPIDGLGTFLLSASLDGDNLSMWRAYGSADISYAVGIDPTKHLAPIGRTEDVDPHPRPDYETNRFIEGDDGQRAEIPGWDAPYFSDSFWFKAEYDHERSAEIVNSTLDHLQELAAKVQDPVSGQGWEALSYYISLTFMGVEINARRDLAIFQIKHPGFADEKEARLVLRVSPSWRFIDYRQSKLGFVPYVKLTSFEKSGLLGDFPSKAEHLPIKEIRIGPARYPELAKSSLEALLAKWGYHEVQVTLSEIPFRPV